MIRSIFSWLMKLSFTVFHLLHKEVNLINLIFSGHEVVASTGGKPKPKVEMIFRSIDGRPLRAAKFGDTVEFYVALSPDSKFRSLSTNSRPIITIPYRKCSMKKWFRIEYHPHMRISALSLQLHTIKIVYYLWSKIIT